MRTILLITTILCSIISFGQTLEKGIYKGEQLPFTICYFTNTDSIIEVEYFCQKGGQIFGHKPAKIVKIGMESYATKPEFKSDDDSILIFNKSEYFLVKGLGIGKVKVYKSTDTQKSIITLRNRNRLFDSSHRLFDELNIKEKTNQQKFWDDFNSFELDKYTTIDEDTFNKKLKETIDKIKKNRL